MKYIITESQLKVLLEQDVKDINTYPFCVRWFGNPTASKSGQWSISGKKQFKNYFFYNNGRVLNPNGKLENYTCSNNSISINGRTYPDTWIDYTPEIKKDFFGSGPYSYKSYQPTGYNNTQLDELVNILFTARDKSWASGIKKSLFNTKDSVKEFANSIVSWSKKNKSYDPKLLKAAITIIFRESKASNASFLSPKETLGFWYNMLGGDSSQGFAQIKPSTAKRYNIDTKALYSYEGALDASYKILSTNYQKAKQYYSGPKVSMFINGSLVEKDALDNDAALHMSVAAHNAGEGIINRWCMTNMQSVANLCSVKERKPYDDGKIAVTDKSKPIKNYFPNIGNVHNYIPQFRTAYNELVKVPDILNKI